MLAIFDVAPADPWRFTGSSDHGSATSMAAVSRL